MDTWSAAIMLFLIMDPLGNLPVFMSVLKSIEPKRRQIILIRELLFALGILFIFLFSGKSVLNFLNVEQETVSIAGGIILFLIALKMIFPSSGNPSGLAVGEEPFLVPLAIPMMAGPGSISLLISLNEEFNSSSQIFTTLLAVLIVCIICYIMLRSSQYIVRVLGANGINSISRIIGFI